MIDHPTRPPRFILRSAPWLLTTLALVGCDTSGRAGKGPHTQSDRLMATYPHLSTGRFWVIADFEQLDHYQIFHVDSHSGAATFIPGNISGVPETGRRCLRVTLADPLDALVISNAQASTWSLRRDWRDFHLLIAAVHCPQDALDLGVAVTAGPRRRAATVQTRTRLHRGWNVLRLDLAEMAEKIPIDDVRELRFSLPQAQKPTDLTFDDLILADNRESIFGSPEGPAEGLYIQRQGRRLNIGAAGRFEFGFANGQVVQWYDLGNDPHRLRNLAAGGVLGPSPVVLSGLPYGPDTILSTDFSALGDTIVAHQEVIEANAVRVIIACTLRFTPDGRQPGEDSPFHQWTYTILRTGQIYAHFECTTESGDWRPESIGLIASRTIYARQETWTHPAADPAGDRPSQPVAFATAQPKALARSGLLMAMHGPADRFVVDVFARDAPRRLELFFVGDSLDRPTHAWPCLLSIWPPGNTDPPAAEVLARDFALPARPETLVGKLVTDSPGDADHDGFNEWFGAFILEPEGDLVRLEIDGTAQPRVNPVFSVRQTAGRQVWVYLDNVILEPVARDPRGDVLFQLPATIRGRSLVEVVIRAGHAIAGP